MSTRIQKALRMTTICAVGGLLIAAAMRFGYIIPMTIAMETTRFTPGCAAVVIEDGDFFLQCPRVPMHLREAPIAMDEPVAQPEVQLTAGNER